MNRRERLLNALTIFQEWVLPWLSEDPYIPDGTDEIERELQLSLHNFLKVPIHSHFQSQSILSPQIQWAFLPYYEEDLSLMDWCCAFLSRCYCLFLLASFIVSYFDRRKALILHFISINCVVLMGFANFIDGLWWCCYGESLRHPSASMPLGGKGAFFFGNMVLTLMFIAIISRTAYLYNRIRRYRKFREQRILARALKERRCLFGG